MKSKLAYYSQKINQIYNYLSGGNDDFPLEFRVFNTVCIMGILTTVLAIFWNVTNDISPITNIPIAFLFILFIVLYYFSRFKKLMKTMPFVLGAVISLSIIWFLSEGSEGSTPYLYILALIIILIISKPNLYFRYTLLIVVNILVLFIVELIFKDDFMLNYPSENVKKLDIIFTFFIVVITAAFLLKVFKETYLIENVNLKNAQTDLVKLSKAASNTSDIIFMTDPRGIITYVNPQFTKLYGYQSEEIINIATPQILKSGYHSEEFYSKFWKELSDTGHILNFKFVNKSKNGDMVDVEVSVNSINDDQENLIGFICTQRDIKERKQAEIVQNILLNIANYSHNQKSLKDFSIFIQRELGRIVAVNNFFVANYDDTKATIHKVYSEDEKDEVEDFTVAKTRTGLVVKSGKSLLIKKAEVLKLNAANILGIEGRISEVWVGIPLKISDKTIGVLVLQSYDNEDAYTKEDLHILEIIARQISHSIENKMYEEQLIKSKEKAEESDRLKSAFLANMSHEIRTPMSGILGFSSLLKNPELNTDKQQKYISIIEKSGQRLLTTINDIVEISKIESGNLEVKLSSVNLNSHLDELFAFFNQEATKKGIHLVIKNRLAEDEAIVRTDVYKVFGIATNLIKNAIKFTKKGSVEFGYTSTNDTFELRVKDTGIGIPKDRQDFIFDRFIQADIEDKEVHEGSGLGLSIVKAYVELLGGHIQFESKEGEGSMFVVSLPKDLLDVKSVPSKVALSKKSGELPSSNIKILLVEDDEISKVYLSEVLNSITNDILFAKNGMEALKMVRENTAIDVILMDIKLPDINGYEVTKNIRATNKDVIIIAQTAYALSSDREKAVEAGCNDYISKPISEASLVAIINKYIN